jgi:release factor glutamine methyltransferase
MSEMQKVWTIAELLSKAAEHLQDKGLENPRLNAEIMLGHLLSLKRLELYLHHDRPLNRRELSTFRDMIKRRLAGYPLQYLTGETDFFSLTFQVNPYALIPRPETEILVEAVLSRVRGLEPPREIADLGTGSGVIAITLAIHLAESQLWAMDCSSGALALARKNARRHGVADRIRFFQGDLFEPLKGREGSLAAVVSNPPYVSSNQLKNLSREIRLHEPSLALDGGPDGLGVIRRIVAGAPQYLRNDGILAVEVGDGQAPEVQKMVVETGAFGLPCAVKDYLGVERVVMAEKAVER